MFAGPFVGGILAFTRLPYHVGALTVAAAAIRRWRGRGLLRADLGFGTQNAWDVPEAILGAAIRCVYRTLILDFRRRVSCLFADERCCRPNGGADAERPQSIVSEEAERPSLINFRAPTGGKE